MRRFLIWSALALVVGLLVAGGGYWAYWNFYARYEPVVISRNQTEIQRLLDEASWVSGGGGGEPLYFIAYRDSGAARAYQQSEFDKLRAAGVEPRVILFARPPREGLEQSTPAERATVAEIWLTRDYTLYQRWAATPARNWTAAGVPPADGNLARTAVVGAGQDFKRRLDDLLRGAGFNATGYPLILWRDREGFLKACACAFEKSWAFIRDDFDAPERVAPDVPPAPQDVLTGADAPLAYPNVERPDPGTGTLPAIPPSTAPGATAPATTGAAASPPSAAPRPSTTPRPAPTAKQQDDTTFY